MCSFSCGLSLPISCLNNSKTKILFGDLSMQRCFKEEVERNKGMSYWHGIWLLVFCSFPSQHLQNMEGKYLIKKDMRSTVSGSHQGLSILTYCPHSGMNEFI